MAQSTRARCPFCGHDNELGAVITGNTFVGNPMIIGVRCASCRRVFDATSGGDGTYDTGPDGRLALRDAVFEARSAILTRRTAVSDVEDFIEQLRQGGEPEEPEDPWLARVWQWLHTHPIAKQYTAPVLVGIFVLLLTLIAEDDESPKPEPPAAVTVVVDMPDDPQLKEIVEDLERFRRELLDETLRGGGERSMHPQDPE